MQSVLSQLWFSRVLLGFFWNQNQWRSLTLTSCTGTSRIFCPKLPHFLSFKYVTQAKQMSVLLLNNFCPVISHRRVQKEKKTTNYCCGHSLWSANQLPVQVVNVQYYLWTMIWTCASLYVHFVSQNKMQ